MHLAHILPLVLAGIAAALPSAEHLNRKDDNPSPPGIQLVNFVYSGSGCTAGAVSAKTSADKSKLMLEYDRFVAVAGRNISAAYSRRNCQINFRFRFPAGWQFSVARAEYLGYAQIEAGLTGLTRSTYYFSGERAQVSYNETINGPYDDLYHRVDLFNPTETVWSPCGGSEALLNINSEVRLSPIRANNTLAGTMSIDATDGFALTWQRCPQVTPPPVPLPSTSPVP